MDNFELSLGAVVTIIIVIFVTLLAGVIGNEAWRASEKAAAYKAYTQCLHEMQNQPIDIKQMFCGKIREQL